MRLRSIWSMPGYPLRERLHRTGEWTLITIAHHMPRQLQFRVFCAVVARYSFVHPKAEVPAISVNDILREYAR